jgi:hypothetical protein
MALLSPPSGDVTTSLKFYLPPPDGSSPYYSVSALEAESTRNYGQKDHPVLVQDIRGHEHAFKLETNGFMALSKAPAENSVLFTDHEDIRLNYYPQVERLLHSTLKPKRIYVFDHTVRSSTSGAPSRPVHHVHIDQTPFSAEARVYVHLPEEADHLLKERVRLINVWRPIGGPVWTEPLAYADSASVNEDDLIAVRHIYPDREGETFALQHAKGQKWYYWSGMTSENVIFLLCYDSESRSRVPHSAFTDPRTLEGAPSRESIEVRALLFG